MARTALAAGLAACAAAAVASATSGASGGARQGDAAAANRAPIASLHAKHRRVEVGRKVVLDSSRSHDPDGRIVQRLWDLDGDGIYERTGRKARIRHAFDEPGKVRIGVIVVDDGGAYAVRHARIRAVAADGDYEATPRDERGSKKPHRRERVRAATNEKQAGPGAPPRAKAAAPTTPTVSAAASSSNSVTIKDFKYDPKSITVSVGTTVTWTNQDSSIHTATADDGTFDTGSISKGASQSYTFTKAGKFSYHCTPHASFMKGATVTVTASGGSSGNGNSGGSSFSDSSGSSSGSGSSNGSSKDSSLPYTGLEIAAVALAGLALLGAGAALRRRLVRD